MNRRRVLIVEDEAVVQLHLGEIVEELGYRVTGVAADADQAMTLAAADPPDLVLMDIRLRGDCDGVEVARRLQRLCAPGIVFLTAFADAETVARTEQIGAMGYVVKPYNRHEVRAALATAIVLRDRFRAVEDGNKRDGGIPEVEPRASEPDAHGMLGRSAAMVAVRARIEEIAVIDWPVLIDGETGTGKELTARALHRASQRRHGPFVAVNCAGLSEALLGSLLFGHRKGAFTGADEDQQGFFEAAAGGVLFLDEIADMSPRLQRTLLRVLDDGLIQRLGETTSLPVDTRVVSATQRDLAREVDAGRFRADLLYRLRTVRISLPPLRERLDDLDPLIEHFLAEAEATLGRSRLTLSDAVRRRLLGYRWPGNVRELRNVVNHAALVCRGGEIREMHLPEELLAVDDFIGDDASLHDADERTRILAALKRAGGNRTLAASILGMSRATLYRRFEALGIDP